MKKILLTLISFVFITGLFAGQLVLINCDNASELKSLFSDKNVSVHYYSGNIAIATTQETYKGNFQVIASNGFKAGHDFYIAWFHKTKDIEYVKNIKAEFQVVVESDQYLIISTTSDKAVFPPTDGRITRITNKTVKEPAKKFLYTKDALLVDPDIEQMIADVDTNIYLNNLQNLQDYGTRNAYSPEAVQAQNWIKTQFESYGYSVELFDFTMPNGPASDDVIATKTGTKYPDEYVVLGGHYDSYTWTGDAPGADDDGSGTCGVLEAARVMADFETDRTVLFCAWSGEEYGLYGSEAWANWAAGEGLNIIGYFNIDMCGYRNPSDPIHTDMIAPSSAQPLVDFYTDVCALYLPDFIVEPGNLTGGDSDHTSFNNAGYMGIFPFEDSQNYSPYIHTTSDLIGLSVNSLEMCMLFTQAMVANVATMANWMSPPDNLVAMPGDGLVELAWDPMEDVDSYNVYKNNGPSPIANITEPFFTDDDVENFSTYTYYITAIYSGTGDESDPSKVVTVTPLPPMTFPFTDDFETGALYWNFEDTWGLSSSQSYSPTHSLTESPTGNYPNNTESSTTLYSFSLEDAVSAELSFMTKFNLEEDYDYIWLEISTNGIDWTELDEFNGSQNSWIEKTYSLADYLEEPYVVLRFRFYSDGYVTEDGMYIDDLVLDIENSGVGISEPENNDRLIMINPNPFSQKTSIRFEGNYQGNIEVNIYNTHGEIVKAYPAVYSSGEGVTLQFDGTELPAGVYFCTLNLENGKSEVKKMILIK